jgi:uncharacterized protein YkwD
MKLPRVTQVTVLIMGSFIFASVELWAGVGLFTTKSMSERRIPLSLSAILCARPATADDLFKNGMFDAQVQVVRLNPKGTSKVSLQQSQERAKKLASDHEQGAYAHGLCADGGAWVMALPVADAVKVEGESLKIPVALNRTCAAGTLKASFVPEAKGRSLALTIAKNNVATLPNLRGYAAISCVLNQNRNGGPRELALVPVAGASIDATEIGKKAFAKIEGSLAAWVNEKRKLENLPALLENNDLSNAARSLVGKKMILHNVEALTAMRKVLNANGIEPQGEDRVQGRDINELAGLLWISPSHRDLILSPSADVMGVALNNDDSGQFAVIVVGKKSGGAVAKRMTK